MPFQKISNVTVENGMLHIYVEDGSELTNFGYGNEIPSILSQTQFGVLVSWYDPNQDSTNYCVYMAGECQEATIHSGNYIPDNWKKEVRQLYFDSLPHSENNYSEEINYGSTEKAITAHTPTQKEINEERAWGFAYFIGFILSCVVFYFTRTWGSAGLAFSAGTILTLFYFKIILKGIGCLAFVLFFGIMFQECYDIMPPEKVGIPTQEKIPVQETKVSPKKNISTYLKGINNISNSNELGNFYFAIANNFYHNDMGLKGTPEQIAAGNKLMVRVYDFLGTSAKKEKILNVDSMKFFIKNYTQVSDFRKKKALEELQLGINKIESINK